MQSNITCSCQQVNVKPTTPISNQQVIDDIDIMKPMQVDKIIKEKYELVMMKNGSEKTNVGTTQTTIPKNKAMATMAT